jgi:para-aminobenzoate synthetase / 4-amino-4-deoxychorismate lyase
VPAGDPQIDFAGPPSADPSLGVFETLLVADGVPLELGRHLARLAASMHALYGDALPETLSSEIMAAAEGHPLARLRVDVTDSPAIHVTPFDRALVLPTAVMELATVSVSAGFGTHKLIDRSWLAQIEAETGEGVRPLLVSRSGALLETTRANVFVVRDGVLATPPLDGSILPGVMRDVLLARARRAGFTALELPLTLDDLREADVVLLTSSLRLLERARANRRRHSADVVARLRETLAP